MIYLKDIHKHYGRESTGSRPSTACPAVSKSAGRGGHGAVRVRQIVPAVRHGRAEHPGPGPVRSGRHRRVQPQPGPAGRFRGGNIWGSCSRIFLLVALPEPAGKTSCCPGRPVHEKQPETRPGPGRSGPGGLAAKAGHLPRPGFRPASRNGPRGSGHCQSAAHYSGRRAHRQPGRGLRPGGHGTCWPG
jgi:hypothetical protein